MEITKDRMFSKKYSYIVILLVVFVGGFLWGSNTVSSANATANLDTFWRVWDLMQQKYGYQDKVPNESDRVAGAIRGMVASYDDPYTTYLTKEELSVFQEDIDGSFFGIGVEVGIREGKLTVISPLKDSSAQQAGVQSGDIIAEIEGESTMDMSIEQAIKKIRGPENTQVKITFIRSSEKLPITLSLTRKPIELPVIETKVVNNVYVVSLYTFNKQALSKIYNALQSAQKKSYDGIVLDLRGNPGGILDTAVDISSMFLPKGEVVVREKIREGSTTKTKVFRSQGYNVVPKTMPVVVLIDKGSASASEIVAGALQDHDRAPLFGSQTFGKGSVQELISLPDGSGLKITVASWFTPDHHSISEKGLTPDTVVTDPDPQDSVDEVLDTAIAYIKANR